jgi:multicomponent Na+:H+ antiporter subunit D
MFSALAFTFLIRTGLYPPELRSTNLDFDWTYRRLLPRVIARLRGVDRRLRPGLVDKGRLRVKGLVRWIYRHHGPRGYLARTWPTGSMVLWVAILLGSCLIFYYL